MDGKIFPGTESVIRDPERLARLTPCRDSGVAQMLEVTDCRCLVAENGAIYTPDTPPGRDIKALARLIRANLNLDTTPDINQVDLAAWQQWEALDETSQSQHSDQQPESDAAILWVNLLAETVELGASDIHIRIRNRRAEAWLRIHSELFHHRHYTAEQGLRLCRVAFNSKGALKSEFHPDKTCDASFEFSIDGKTYGVRLNSMPEIRGCTLSARLRNPHLVLPLDRAGYSPEQRQSITAATRKHGGLLLFCGPTNSGKSTSVATILSDIEPSRSIISLEEPVEIQLEHVAHVEIDRRQHEQTRELITATVRQDPDILCLGEIRDETTTHTAERLALIGKLVISTLHTDTVTSAPRRLMELGMTPSSFGCPGFLNTLVAQSLVPTLCPQCTLTQPPAERAALYSSGFDHPQLEGAREGARYRHPDGCPSCRHTGIAGLSLVAEVLPVNREVRRLFADEDIDGIRQRMAYNGIASRHAHAAGRIAAGEMDLLAVEQRIDPYNPEEPCQ